MVDVNVTGDPAMYVYFATYTITLVIGAVAVFFGYVLARKGESNSSSAPKA